MTNRERVQRLEKELCQLIDTLLDELQGESESNHTKTLRRIEVICALLPVIKGIAWSGD